MRTIWKFPIDIGDHVAVVMPTGAQVLTVQMQRGQPCLWAVVDSDAELVTRLFAWRGTGHLADGLGALSYVGTVQAMSGDLVFHLFERTPL